MSTEDEQQRRRESALILLQALEVYDAAASAVSRDLAAVAARDVVLGWDVEQLQRVAVALAVTAVWQLPPAVESPVYAGQIRFRLAQVRGWVTRMRLEAGWVAS